MPLTPEDVSNKRFTPVRLREGYDMGEVDEFLDEVEAELARLTRDNDDLRSKLSADSNGGLAAKSDGASPVATKPETAGPDTAGPDTAGPDTAGPDTAVPVESGTAPAPAAASDVTHETVPETIKVHTVADASSAAARLLEIATRNADELVTEAKNEAEQIVGDARTRAADMESESRATADQFESDARARSQMLDSETAERRQELLQDLDQERERLNGEVENLRSFEREYRSRLKSYFQQQLEALDGPGQNDGSADASINEPVRGDAALGDGSKPAAR
ncbi:MAG: DivIVA domain-containing protein [Actinomycetota bacterium]|nr:DivIVA domain-containing protein [Actinomycetota bacterium]